MKTVIANKVSGLLRICETHQRQSISDSFSDKNESGRHVPCQLDFDIYANRVAYQLKRMMNHLCFPSNNHIAKEDVLILRSESRQHFGDFILFVGGAQFPLLQRLIGRAAARDKEITAESGKVVAET